jgi:hypothetical protein
MTGVYRHDPNGAGNEAGVPAAMVPGGLPRNVTGRLADLILGPVMAYGHYHWLFSQLNTIICWCSHGQPRKR